MRRILVAALLLCLTQLAGAFWVADYFRDRGLDFLDIFRLRLGAPEEFLNGAGFHVRATSLAQVGAMYFDGSLFGIERRAMGLWRERRAEGGISLIYFTDVHNEPIFGNRFTSHDDYWTTYSYRGILRNNVYWDDGRNRPFSLGVELQPGILPGIDVGLYPMEALDFVVGFFFLDPFKDDLYLIDRALRRESQAPPAESTYEADLETMIRTLEEKAQ